jgi:hypothetical protein
MDLGALGPASQHDLEKTTEDLWALFICKLRCQRRIVFDDSYRYENVLFTKIKILFLIPSPTS